MKSIQIFLKPLHSKFAVGLLWGLTVFEFIKSLRTQIYDPDMWWHLASGRAMIENRCILRADIFSHTLQGSSWVDFEWLSQLIMYGMVRLFGLNALYFGKIILSLTCMGLIVYLARLKKIQGAWLCALTWTGFLLLRPRFLERPELATLNFMALTSILVFSIKERAWTKKWIFPALVFLVFALWVNLHGGFIYGLGLLILFNAGARWAGEPKDFLRPLDRATLSAGLGTLVNPYGLRIASIYWKHLMQFKGGSAQIQEWYPASINDLPFFWLIVVLLFSFLIIGFLRSRPWNRFWILPVLVFSAWGSLYYRNAALVTFVAIPFLANILSDWGSMLISPGQQRRFAAAGLVLCVIFIGRQSPLLTKPWPKEKIAWQFLPVGGCRFVSDNNIKGTMFNSYNIGGYIEWILGPSRLIFMDGRYIFHPLLMETVPLYGGTDVLSMKDSWQDYFDRKKVDYAIMPYEQRSLNVVNAIQPFNLSIMNVMFPRPNWALVYWDDACCVFLKRSVQFSAEIEKFEFKVTRPYNIEQMASLIKENLIDKEELKKELGRHAGEVGITQKGRALDELVAQ